MGKSQGQFDMIEVLILIFINKQSDSIIFYCICQVRKFRHKFEVEDKNRKRGKIRRIMFQQNGEIEKLNMSNNKPG